MCCVPYFLYYKLHLTVSHIVKWSCLSVKDRTWPWHWNLARYYEDVPLYYCIKNEVARWRLSRLRAKTGQSDLLACHIHRWQKLTTGIHIRCSGRKFLQAFQRAIDGVCTLPLSSQWVAQKPIFVFLKIKCHFNRIKSATKLLCVKTFSGRVVVQPFPYLMFHRYWRET